MSDALPADPYSALGVAKDATAAAIKAQYRKLVLKFHPDKVQDEEQKVAAAEQFHKIQSAYEIVSDDEKRARYDAQCKLAELRKDMSNRQPSSRGTDSYSSRPAETPRTYETREVRPDYADSKPTYSTDYFDIPHASSRKAADTERASKRSDPRDDRKSTKSSTKDPKKSERAEREERSRRATKDIRRDREQKSSVAGDFGPSSDSDDLHRSARRSREDDDVRRARESFREAPRRSRDDIPHSSYDSDDKSHKQYNDAQDYISRSRRRPSPSSRQSSTKFVYVQSRDGGRPSVVRRDSLRPAESRRTSSRDFDASNGDAPRRPPNITTSYSSPADIKIPVDKPRAQSVQMERDRDPPPTKRSETMPQAEMRDRENRRSKESAMPSMPHRSSTLRQAETPSDYGDQTLDAFGISSSRQRRSHDEYPSTRYQTEIREPEGVARPPRYTRSPSPVGRMRDIERERARPERRTTSSRYTTESVSPRRPPILNRTTSTNYASYASYARPSLSRENSSRIGRPLYGEVRNTVPVGVTLKSSPTTKQGPYFGNVEYRRAYRGEDVHVTDYNGGRRSSEARGPYSSQGENNQSTPIYAR